MRVDLFSIWYRPSLHPIAILLLPLTGLFALCVLIRRWFYRSRLLKSQRFAVPVIVVGNVTVGGTGKTPLVMQLAQLLQAHGYQPGIVSRGYGGKQQREPSWVRADSAAVVVGDEAILLARHSGCPVVVGADRVAAVRELLQRARCDVVISDDGLQHYRLERDIEIAVVDGARRFGNGLWLPSGPLRESVTRLRAVNFVLVNGGEVRQQEYAFAVTGDSLIAVADNETTVQLTAFSKQTVHAVAGIGHPERFFSQLRQAGLRVITHVFPDHHQYQLADIQFNDALPVIMTEKDAVKCTAFVDQRYWYLRVRARVDQRFEQALLTALATMNGNRNAEADFAKPTCARMNAIHHDNGERE